MFIVPMGARVETWRPTCAPANARLMRRRLKIPSSHAQRHRQIEGEWGPVSCKIEPVTEVVPPP